MNQRSWLRDFVLLAAAGLIGWWAHSAVRPVYAAPTHEDDISVQVGGIGGRETMAVYSPSLRAVFIYPMQAGNSHIGCEYAFSITKPGAAIDRVNCPSVPLFGH